MRCKFIIIFILFFVSCSPDLYVKSILMRNFNTSKNKYKKKKPYYYDKRNIKFGGLKNSLYFCKKLNQNEI
jgi:hypothetical protein